MAVSSRVQTTFTANANGLVAGTKRASTALENMQRSLFNLNRQMNGLIAIQGVQLFAGITRGATYALGAVTNLSRSIAGEITKAVNSAVDLGEETSKSFVVFGDAADKIQEFSISAARIGLSETAALQATGTFGNLFRAMGVGQGKAAEYAETMTRLSADLASFSNTSVDEAVLAVGAALRGEAEPIRRFGVLLNEATLKNEALAQGLIKSAKGSLDPATKAMAAYQLILRQTALAQGDFARTSDGMANLQRIVSAQASNLVTEVGGAFEGMFTAATKAVSDVLGAVKPLISGISEGIGQALSVVAAAIKEISAEFVNFISSVDVSTVGDSVRDALLDGIIILARGADYLSEMVSGAFEYAGSVADIWSGVVAVFDTVSSGLKAVFYTGEAVFKAVAALLLRSASGWSAIIEALPDSITGDGWSEFADELGKQADRLSSEADAAGAKAIENAFKTVAGDTAKGLGDSLERPVGRFEGMLVGLREQLEQMDQATATVGQSAGQAVKNAGEVAAANIQAAARELTGTDARSTQGVNQIVAALNGGNGNEPALRLARAQLRVQQEIAAKTGQGLQLELAGI